MCSIPPPPPLKTELFLEEKLKVENDRNSKSNCVAPDLSLCRWASVYPELQKACTRHGLFLETAPLRFQYKNVESILQIGPTCGLVAISMMVGGVSVEEVFRIAKEKGYSNNGEIFSAKYMVKLLKEVLNICQIDNVSVELKTGELCSNSTINKLLEKCLLLVPYDADFNHSPCLKQGHKAHWALVCGVMAPANSSGAEQVYVTCRHGKSRHLAIWSLEQLESSNRNLYEFSPKRGDDDLIYVLPDGGIGGENGLCNQYVLIEGL